MTVALILKSTSEPSTTKKHQRVRSTLHHGKKMFKTGMIYYECSIARVDASPVVVVSSWRYEGVVQCKQTSPSCDQPYHFYRFVEYTSYRNEQHHPDHHSFPRLFPSLEKAGERLFKFQELQERLVLAFEDLGLQTYVREEPCVCCNSHEVSGVLWDVDTAYPLCDSCCAIAKSSICVPDDKKD